MKMLSIRTKFAAALGAAGILFASAPGTSHAQQNYPDRPITLLVGYAAGGPTDNAARVVAEQLSKELGQPIVVSNKPGASSLVAARELMASKPDGYTLLLVANALFTLGPARYEKVDYDYQRDFTPVGGVAGYPHVLIVPATSDVKTFDDLIKKAKANPGKLNAARVGFTNEIAIEWINQLAGIKLAQIPYKGGATVVSDLSSGRIDLALVAPSVAFPLIDGGKARAIATTRSTPITDQRKIPSVAQSGMKEFDFYVWNGIVAPAGTPAPIIEILNKALEKAVMQPAVAKQLATAYLDIAPKSPEKFTEDILKESKDARQVVKDANLPLLKQ